MKSFYKGDKEVGWVSGSVMAIKREILEKIGLLDDKIFMYGEDTEYCIRAIKKGFKVGWTDKATIVHIGGGSSKNPSFRQWLGEIKGLKYIYKKFNNKTEQLFLNILIYVSIILRIIAFSLIGKFNVSKLYGKILFNI